jgi:hypothetical protein
LGEDVVVDFTNRRQKGLEGTLLRLCWAPAGIYAVVDFFGDDCPSVCYLRDVERMEEVKVNVCIEDYGGLRDDKDEPCDVCGKPSKWKIRADAVCGDVVQYVCDLHLGERAAHIRDCAYEELWR